MENSLKAEKLLSKKKINFQKKKRRNIFYLKLINLLTFFYQNFGKMLIIFQMQNIAFMHFSCTYM